MIEKYYTPEQQDYLQERRQLLSEEFVFAKVKLTGKH